jgi:serine/threonine protein phosphatase PrpC
MSRIVTYGKTDVGLKRGNNEDAFSEDPEIGVCLVSDGMGGAAAGELASRIFVETALGIFSNSGEVTEEENMERVRKAFVRANDQILAHVKENLHHRGMGCTGELLAFSNGGFVIGHIGDSRTYRLRNGKLKQLTHDHSLVQNQLDKGLITQAEARKHPQRNVIHKALGIDDHLYPDILNGSTCPKDLFLLCSDGLTDMIEDETILQILNSEITISRKADNLIEAALDAGGKDNVTVLLSEVI